MEYFVPQIKHEAKIGGITFPQIITIGIGLGLIFVVFFLWPDYMPYFAPIIGGITVIFTFLNIHGMSFPVFLGKMIAYQFFGHTYIWQSKEAKDIIAENQRTNALKTTSEPAQAPESYPTAKREGGINKLNKML